MPEVRGQSSALPWLRVPDPGSVNQCRPPQSNQPLSRLLAFTRCHNINLRPIKPSIMPTFHQADGDLRGLEQKTTRFLEPFNLSKSSPVSIHRWNPAGAGVPLRRSYIRLKISSWQTERARMYVSVRRGGQDEADGETSWQDMSTVRPVQQQLEANRSVHMCCGDVQCSSGGNNCRILIYVR